MKHHRAKRAQGLAPWTPDDRSFELMQQVLAVIDEYRDHLPLTGRQIFYRLVGNYGYAKTEKDYKSLLNKITRGRRSGMIPWEAIRDDGVVEAGASGWSGLGIFGRSINAAARGFTLDRMIGQPAVIELWVEAAGMVPQMQRVAQEFGIDVYSSGGFNSVTMKHDSVQRFMQRWDNEGRPTVMLHVGDHDPSGVSIYTNLDEDLHQFLFDYGYYEDELLCQRIAVTPEQASMYDLDSAPPKQSDTRSNYWEGETYQVEAMTPVQLADEVRSAIGAHYDFGVLEGLLEREQDERDRLIRFTQDIDWEAV